MIAMLEEVLRIVEAQQVKYILIGGWAATIHGYARDRDNIRRLAQALQPYSPYLRGAPPGLPFKWDEATIRNGLNFTLTTTKGDIDFLGEVAGGGTYEQLLPFSTLVKAAGTVCRCVTLEKLIQLKRAAGRPKDLEAIAELRALLAEKRRSETPQ
jgi:predicted nucleotidyltransferase